MSCNFSASNVSLQSLTGFCFFVVLGLCHRGIKSVIRRLRKMMKFTYNNTDGNNTNRSAFLRSFGFSCYDFKSFMKYWLTEKEIDEETNRPLYEFGVYCIDFLNDFNLSKFRGELRHNTKYRIFCFVFARLVEFDGILWEKTFTKII